MANSLFDNRYRYDYIYPRGRSGETLRAVDTQADDRPVVIKRPNPSDAPPIRAGQEVSIINEREALTRLAGHPVLTELLGAGQFFVGGIPQQYIVMERAQGVIIADEVTRLASQQQRLPQLEMVEIISRVIDLLGAAHAKDIVYNDVDAKHLFWQREQYQLKVIDWGNAVFLEGDEATLAGISRQTDIYQLGELLYFILSGGHRIEVPRDGDADFQVDFHGDSSDIDFRLQAIVTRAVHPNLRYRYAALSEFSADLQRFRRPLERERDAIVARVNGKLGAANLSRNDLLALQANLGAALRQNPAYPAARAAGQDIVDRLRDLEVSADLDAVKIYLQSDNWARAAELLSELRDRAGSKTAGLVRLLLDWCLLLADSPLSSAPPGLAQATGLLFDYRADKAANTLLLSDTDDDAVRALCLQLAERVSAHFPAVLLLQPNLRRLDAALRQLEADGIPVDEARDILAAVRRSLESALQLPKPGAGAMRDIYGDVVDSLSALHANLQALSLQHEFSERRLPLNALARALNAAKALADNMRVIGKQAAGNPREALAALDASRAIDPPNPVWDTIEDSLSLLYELLKSSQTFVPAADGSDVESWLSERRDDLSPFAGMLFDDSLTAMLDGLESAGAAWARYRDVVIAGDKTEAVRVLTDAGSAVSAISPTLSNWFNQLRSVVENANYVERHSVPGHLGRTLADGWAAFDRGQLADAQRLGQQALEIARNDSEQFIAERLWRLSRIVRDWVERNGAESEDRSEKALLEIEDLFTDAENRAINSFATQMPSTETYLKAMGQGLVSALGNSNTAALRILYAQYILSGVLDAHDGAIDDAGFWHAAALRALPEAAERHIATQKLTEITQKRRHLLAAQSNLNDVTGPQIVDSLGEIARRLEHNPQARLLVSGVQSLRAFESAVADWADAEFRAAGNKIEQALRGITEVESNASIKLPAYRAWLMELQAALAELSVKRRNLLNEIDRQPDIPPPAIREAIHAQADITEDLLGYKTAQMMLGWRDTYEAFHSAYSGDKRRGEKLDHMDELLKDMFIDRHPAYPLFRHWYRQVEALPEEPPEPEAPAPLEPAAVTAPAGEHAWKGEETAPQDESQASKSGDRGWLFNIAALLGVLLILGGLLSLANSGNLQDMLAALAPAATAAPAADADDPAEGVEADAEASSAEDAEAAPAADDSALDQAPEPAPAATEAPQLTAPPTEAPDRALLPTAILPPEGLTGAQNLLALYRDAADWDAEHFSPSDASWRLGMADASDGETIRLAPSADLLDSTYGATASRRIARLEAELALHSANPALADDDAVYFGVLLQGATGERSAGLQIQQEAPDVISLALVVDGQADVISQRAVNNLITRLRLQRDPASGAVSAYFNDAQVGDAIDFVPADAAVEPVIFVKDGVIISVTAWEITLD